MSVAELLTPAGLSGLGAVAYATLLRGTLVVVAGAVALHALRAARRASAAERATVAAAALGALLALPLLRWLPGGWAAGVVPAPLAAPLFTAGAAEVAAGAARSTHFADVSPVDPALLAWPRATAALALWAAGTAVVLLGLARGWLALARIRRRAAPVDDAEWTAIVDEARAALGVRRRVRVLRDPAGTTPLTWGTLRPVLLLPAAADAWPTAHRRAVVLHELAHVRACDTLVRVAGRVACALYWFHPGVWWLARRHQAEREEACDDRALAAGVRASDYAECLLRVADETDVAREAALGAVAVAAIGASPLRRRVVAVLDARRRRAPVGRLAVAAVAAATALLVAPVGLARLAPTRPALHARLADPSWETRAWAVSMLATRVLTAGAPASAADAEDVRLVTRAMREDPSPRVRFRAANALAALGRARAPRTTLARTAPARTAPGVHGRTETWAEVEESLAKRRLPVRK